ncbi:SDR family NAD(P)-dependent oxidoreductase [Elioraea rosea]|uniref:SDR family NAD(P)-dependent oxidoreductase n=1 Tax=Elioraea rosea TaxID=2492390 RepID=UPI0011831345|nr:SDR family NAD(P)-dependent oxidoreductase [Elioraea rosea]
MLSAVPETGLRVLVTGAARGIGRAIAEGFAAHGGRVLMQDRDDIDALPDGAIAHRGDASDPADIEAAFAAADAAWGGVDVAVANAGVAAKIPALELTPERWRQIVSLNFDGVFFTAQAAGRRMVAQGSGVILALGSIYSVAGAADRSAYCATKAGVAGMMRSLACEWARHGVRVNTIAPGYIETDLVSALVAQGRIDTSVIAARSPQRRLGQAEEVAALALFLASPAAAHITGAVLPVDGGWLANGAP